MILSINQNCTYYVLSKMFLGPDHMSLRSTYTMRDLRTDRPGYNPMIGRLGTDNAVAGAGVGVSGLSAMPPAKIC